MKYQPHIDGLRAIAVLSVILFHAGMPSLSGGFVGVDVFFVISGFLITTIIASDVRSGTFSFRRFYDRRMRRILPALYLVLLVTTAAAWLMLLPVDLSEFGEGLVAVVLFYSNHYFLNEAGYFARSAEIQPLLHTWSLAIEEQYYIIFPMLFLAASRLKAPGTVVIILLGGVCSFVLAQTWMIPAPDAAFFLLPARAWELAIGALAALYVHNTRRSPFTKLQRQIFATIGFAFILIPIFAYEKTTPYPSYFALAPTLGTAVVILTATSSTFVGRLLSMPPLVRIGLISYSAYLWHQPVFAFVRLQFFHEPPQGIFLLSIAAILIAAYLTWRYVEVPFRAPAKLSNGVTISLAIAGAAALVLFGTIAQSTDGFAASFERRLDARQLTIWNSMASPQMVDNNNCHFHTESLTLEVERRFNACARRFDKATIVLGDSHAMDVYNSIAYNAKNPFIFGVSKPYCRPHTPREVCPYDAFLDFARRHSNSISRVIYNQAGFYLLTDESGNSGSRDFFRRYPIPVYAANLGYIDRVVTYLSAIADIVPVLWLGPWTEPHVNTDLIKRLALSCRLQTSAIEPNVTASFARLDQALLRAASANDIDYISADLAMAINWSKDLYSCEGIYWRDGDHLSVVGQKVFGARLVEYLAVTAPSFPAPVFGTGVRSN